MRHGDKMRLNKKQKKNKKCDIRDKRPDKIR